MNSNDVTIISVVGKQNAGKTTLIKNLIPELKRRGYRVGTLKYNIREFEIDREGKDSYKYFHSGADSVALSSHEQVAVMKRVEHPLKLADIIDQYLNDVNVVLVEGYRENEHPRIRIIDTNVAADTAMDNLDNELLIINEESEDRCFSTKETNKALDFIEKALKSGKFY